MLGLRDGSKGKGIATKLCDLRLIPGTYVAEGKNRRPQAMLCPPCAWVAFT